MKFRALRSKIYRYGVLLLFISSFTAMIACKSKDISVDDKMEINNTVSKEGTIENDRDSVGVKEDAKISKAADESVNTGSGHKGVLISIHINHLNYQSYLVYMQIL